MYIGRRNVEGGGRQQSFANNSFRVGCGCPRRDQRWLGLRRLRRSTRTCRPTQHAQLLRDQPPPARARRGGRRRRADLPVRHRWQRPNCVPWNPFQPDGITQEQLDYLQATGLQTGRINQEIYNAAVNGDLGVYGIKSPLATDGIQVVFGTEWRRDTLKNEVDSLQTAGELAGSGGPTIGISGGTQVEELFFEGRVPIAQDRAGMESLSFDTAYRYSDYGDGVQTDTYKFGLEWAPVQDVRLRGSYQRAVRAANIVELFTAQGFNLFDMDGDPCGAAESGDRRRADAECDRFEECVATACRREGRRRRARQPGGPVQLPPGRQHHADSGGIGHVLLRRRVHAAVRAGPCDHDRLLRHQDRQHDLDLRPGELAERLLRQQRSRRPAPGSTATRTGSCGSATATSRTSTSTSARYRRRAGTSTPPTRVWRWAASAAWTST